MAGVMLCDAVCQTLFSVAPGSLRVCRARLLLCKETWCWRCSVISVWGRSESLSIMILRLYTKLIYFRLCKIRLGYVRLIYVELD